MARWPLLTAVAISAALPARAAVVGKLNHVGFPGAVGTSFGRDEGLLVRHGKWAPIRVDLRVEGTSHFTGLLRVTQKDNDGDIVTAQVPVTLTAGANRSRTTWIYCLPRLASNQDLDVAVRLIEIRDDEEERGVQIVTPDGASVDRLVPARELIPVSNEHGLILDVSSRQVDALQWFVRTDKDKPRFRRPYATARLAADALPDAWYGLEMIDYIIWDGADPSVFDESQPQLKAMIEWVRQGGCLVVASEQRWAELARSPLGPVLPVAPGEITQGPTYPGLRALANVPSTVEWPEQTVSFCRIQPRAGARPIPTGAGVKPRSPAETILFERQVGHGRIVAVGAELQKLLNPGGLPSGVRPEDALARLLRIPKATEEIKEHFATMERSLFPQVRSFIDFQAAAGIRLAIAILFVVAYILSATFGSWEWLRRRGQLKHSWSAFALLAVGASAFSVLGVGWVQGFYTRVQQLTIVDGEAGTSRARARAFFGVKTPTHTNVDLWLPDDWVRESAPGETACWLRPIPGAAAGLDTGYAAPDRYQILPARASLHDVPIRATLKQVAGYWTGTLPGQLRAFIRTETVRRTEPLDNGDVWQGTGTQITAESWITNELKVDLVDSYLLHSMNVWPGEEGNPPRRDQDIYIRRLGKIANGQRIDDLAARLYNDSKGKAIPLHQRAGGMKEALTPYSLMNAHRTWAGGEGILRKVFDAIPGLSNAISEFRPKKDGQACDEAIMLLSTLNEYIGAYPRPGSAPVPTDPLRGGYGRSLDRSALLTPDTVLFIGFAEEAGPARLKIRTAGTGNDAWRVLHPRVNPKARRTVYRITIPVTPAKRAAPRTPEAQS